jgi:catechol 2,3-dioxygenase-like lactoylglutathione lyase family enzyme
MRFGAVGLRVTDLKRSLRFYTKVLGLREVRRGDTRAWGGGVWVLLRDPRSRRVVELNWYPKGSRFGTPFRTGDALDHLDFDLGPVPRTTLERAYRRLLAGGGRPTGYRSQTTAGWMASVRDPDGIWITVGRRPTRAERARLQRTTRPKRRRAGAE